jgi:serine/threonine protein kinase
MDTKKDKKEAKVTKEADPDAASKDTHAYMVMGTRFEVDKNYEIIDPIGSGAYGVVVAAKDAKVATGKEGSESNLVAIKKIVKAFEHRVFSLRTYRELKIQRLLEHENVLGIKRILKPKNRAEFNEIYVVSELMETDLAQIIKSNQPLTDDHV